MFRKIVFYDNFTKGLTDIWSTFVLQGILLVLLGVLVLVMPELIAAMVAACFIALGIGSIVIGLKTKKLKKHYKSWRDEFWEPL